MTVEYAVEDEPGHDADGRGSLHSLRVSDFDLDRMTNDQLHALQTLLEQPELDRELVAALLAECEARLR